MTGKSTFSNKFKYRFGIICAYFLFVLLSVLTARIPDRSFKGDAINCETASYWQEGGSYLKTGHDYKKGDVLHLKITFPKDYIGKEIKITCFDFASGKSVEIYKGEAIKIVRETFRIEEDKAAEIQVFTDSGNRNITDSVEIYAAIEHTDG